MKGTIILHPERIPELYRRIMSALDEKRLVFSDSRITEIMRPEKKLLDAINSDSKKDKEEKALWLFLFAPGDRGVVSSLYYEQVARMYEELKKEAVSSLAHLSRRDWAVEDAMHRRLTLRNIDEFKKNFWYNIKKLREDYSFNPLRIFSSKDDGASAVKKLTKFKGYAKNIATLLLLFYSKYDLFKISRLGIKVDRHTIRISESCGIYERQGNPRLDYTANLLFKAYRDFLISGDYNSATFNEGLRTIGVNLCKKLDFCFCQRQCPLEEICTKQQPFLNRATTTLQDPEYRQRRQIPLIF